MIERHIRQPDIRDASDIWLRLKYDDHYRLVYELKMTIGPFEMNKVGHPFDSNVTVPTIYGRGFSLKDAQTRFERSLRDQGYPVPPDLWRSSVQPIQAKACRL